MELLTAVQTPAQRAKSKERLITGEELYARGDIGPSELVAGRIVSHMPTGHPHGFIEGLIAFFLMLFNREHQFGRVLIGETGIYTRRNPDTVRAADVAFISHARLEQVQSNSFLDVAPELVVGIMSPGNSWSEVQAKLAEYFAIGVKLVWVVDPQLEQVHVYRALEQVTLLKKQDTLTGEDVLPGFTLALTEIFDAA
jgi:Uma2 family endonuclease